MSEPSTVAARAGRRTNSKFNSSLTMSVRVAMFSHEHQKTMSKPASVVEHLMFCVRILRPNLLIQVTVYDRRTPTIPDARVPGQQG
jgi:hypothetical protein